MIRAVITSTATSGHMNFRVPTPKAAPCIGVGCSGTDPIFNNGGIGYFVEQALGTYPPIDKCSTPGAPINYHITNPPAFGTYAWPNLGNYQFMHIGDNPNLDGIHDPTILNQWAQRFWTIGNGGAGGETLLWTLQPVFNPDHAAMLAWMTNAETEYNRAQDYCNRRVPAGQRLVRQIPGLQLFRAFLTDQLNGTAPTATWFDDLYIDGFHIVYGKIAYIASAIGAACMYGIDPLSMPNDMSSPSGFTVAEAQYVKATISKTVKQFARAGVNVSAWA